MQTKEDKRIKNNGIFLLRVVATCMVLIVHFGGVFPVPEFLLQSIRFCQHGVIIFFIFSGYLIAESLDRDNNIKLFYINRMCRIIPIYYTVVIINMCFLCLFGYGKLNWLRYLTFTHCILPTRNWVVWNNWAGLWTMSAFAVFYFVAPLFHKIMSNNSYRLFALFTMGGVSIVSSYVFEMLGEGDSVYKYSFLWLKTCSPVVVLYQFVIGMYIFYGIKESRKKEYFLPICMLGIFGIIYDEERFAITALMGIMFLLVIDIKTNTNTKGFKILKIIEEYSFSIYLGHTTVMAITGKLQEVYSFSTLMKTIIDISGTFIFVLFLHQIEKIGVILKKYINKVIF